MNALEAFELVAMWQLPRVVASRGSGAVAVAFAVI